MSKQTKGWSLDSPEKLSETGIIEKLLASSSLWFVLFAVLVGLGVIMTTFMAASSKRPVVQVLNDRNVSVYTDNEHRQFTAELTKMARARGVKMDARFDSDRRFVIVVPCDAAYDEVVFVSKAAAFGVSRRFGVRPVILTYTEAIGSSSPLLTARTTWSDEKSAFVVRTEH